ncbi:hypothetical protein [Microbacterium deminutum]
MTADVGTAFVVTRPLPSRVVSVPGLGRAVSLVTMAALTAIVAWLRLTPTARDTLWAEDGREFLQRAASDPQWTTLLRPYAGYLHLVPRIEAILTVDLVPVQWWADSMTALSCIIAGCVATAVYMSSREFLSWMPARLAVSALTVLTPLASREVLGNAANLHSILFWGVLWVVLATPHTRTGQMAGAAFTLLAALTDIQVVFLLPLLLWNRRDRRTWPIKAALVVGAMAQITAQLLAPRAWGGRGAVSALSLAEGWAINAVASSWIPIPELGRALSAALPGVFLCLLIPLSAMAIIWCVGTRRQQILSSILLIGSIVVWCAGVMVDPAPWYDYAAMSPLELTHVWLSRYGVVPAMMLLAQVGVAADALMRHPATGRRIAARGLMVVLVISLMVQASEPLNRRGAGPAWAPQIATADTQCDSRGHPAATLRETLTWTVRVPCRYVDG